MQCRRSRYLPECPATWSPIKQELIRCTVHATKRAPQGILSPCSIGRLIQLLQFLNSSITPISRPTDLSCTRVRQNTNQLQSLLPVFRLGLSSVSAQCRSPAIAAGDRGERRETLRELVQSAAAAEQCLVTHNFAFQAAQGAHSGLRRWSPSVEPLTAAAASLLPGSRLLVRPEGQVGDCAASRKSVPSLACRSLLLGCLCGEGGG